MGYFLYNGSWSVAVGDVLDFLLVAWQFLGTTVHSDTNLCKCYSCYSFFRACFTHLPLYVAAHIPLNVFEGSWGREFSCYKLELGALIENEFYGFLLTLAGNK